MFVASGVLGGVGLGLKTTASITDPDKARILDRYPEREADCIESCLAGPLFNLLAAPALGSSIGLLGGGMRMRGRWLAHQDFKLGIDRRVKARRMTAAGVGTMVFGAASLAGFLTGSLYADSWRGLVALREAGWWSGIALGYAGASMAGWGMGYLKGHRDIRKLQVRVSPAVTRDFAGLSIAGRF